MKITVDNLGALRHAEIDLKPLTILIGENNTGKTWLAYTIAGALGEYGWHRYVSAFAARKTSVRYKSLEEIIKQIADNGEGVLDIVRFADEYGEKYLNDMLAFSKTWMRRFLSTNHVKFDTLTIKTDFAEFKRSLLENLNDVSIEDQVGRNEETSPLRALKEAGKAKLFFYPGQNIEDRLPTKAIREFVAAIVFREILKFFYPDILTFPTERASLVGDQFISLPRRSVIQRTVRSTDEEGTNIPDEINSILPRLRPQSWHLSSFAFMLAQLYDIGSITDRRVAASENPVIQEYMRLADILQEDILEGKLDFSTPDPAPGREILFQPFEISDVEPIELEVSISSSMTKELSSLVLYLRYLAEPGELLVIDEPEMNLHPAAQVKIIEFLAMLANAKLNVLITTHSTYVVDHLANLINAYKHQDHDNIVKKFLLESKDAFIAQDKVSVYLIDENREGKNILDHEGNIHWQTFSDVTQLVNRIHFELLQEDM